MNDQLNNQNDASAHEEPNYMKIFYWLSALTVIEIGFAMIPNGPFYPKFLQGFLLIASAVWKAALVVMIMALIFFLNDITVPDALSKDLSTSILEPVLDN